ncbi:MAG: acyl-CoA thioesterase/bile acid-CoA:amino acid N-acyltransferase family protein [Chlamydiota bacterium]
MYVKIILPLFCLFSSFLLASPSIRVTKPIALIDEEIGIEIRGLRPFQHVVLHAHTIDAKEIAWSSEAVFCSDERGRVRLTKNAPLEGSYRGVDSMGLFWSMQSDKGPETEFHVPDEMIIDLDLIIETQPIASKTIKRLKKSPEVKSFTINEKGLVGHLYLPPSSQPLPIIITLNGANGGISKEKAQLLASRGFAVLALGYFGLKGLPEKLENIPIEYFAKALEWVQAQPDLDDKHIGLFGISRGAELALLLGTHFPDKIHAIVAVAPSSVTFGALENTTIPAWLLNGKPMNPYPILPRTQLPTLLGKDPKHPLEIAPLIAKAMEKNPSFERASIPVEKIRCPLLLISGDDDKVWPALLFASQIKQRLEEKNSKIFIKHYHYLKAGHQIGLPFIPNSTLYYHPSSQLWFSTGGTPQDNAKASRDSWEKTLVFFQNKLGLKR